MNSTDILKQLRDDLMCNYLQFVAVAKNTHQVIELLKK